MSVKITGVERGSLAHLYRIEPGDELISINGGEIYDMMDLRFYSADTKLDIVLNRNGREFSVEIDKKDDYTPLGLEFDTYLIDKQHSCKNKCIFCFVDQLPSGLRKELYFKDDDERLSFLFGNYITLTNLSRREIDRIKKIRISPINISVHSVEPDLRVEMMKNPAAAKINEIMDEFARAGISMNTQVVLCKGINDGEHLEKTIKRMQELYPRVQSCSVVPVGLTKFRDGLRKVETFDSEECRQVIRQVMDLTEDFFRENGTRLVYLSDEFFIRAGFPLPASDYYGDYLQIENGVGMARTFIDNFNFRLENWTGNTPHVRADMAVGEAFYPIITECFENAKKILGGKPDIKVHCIKNEFFGGNIWVTGLITATDLIKQLRGNLSTDTLLLSRDMLRSQGDMFLDSRTPTEVGQRLGVKTLFFPNDGADFANWLLGDDKQEAQCQNLL